ncbi:hypothetical protein M427DRAFT_37513 [Gonapodya prolifera JEL478]|uniref:Uncharacterized protein n=1 Tax=Gonapodya prolifera (strain JEL478) TaxID=1344416 RepID=A0A139A148_GONPJ|nr:hypothetical protein M427DRAFT_37513 [Gonapodya prolifera JEL478]|eukprot:KXS10348.1 hypothetical protein M427DRAFT_37513 [Gonapodya prolifera JEL478]
MPESTPSRHPARPPAIDTYHLASSTALTATPAFPAPTWNSALSSLHERWNDRLEASQDGLGGQSQLLVDSSTSSSSVWPAQSYKSPATVPAQEFTRQSHSSKIHPRLLVHRTHSENEVPRLKRSWDALVAATKLEDPVPIEPKVSLAPMWNIPFRV